MQSHFFEFESQFAKVIMHDKMAIDSNALTILGSTEIGL